MLRGSVLHEDSGLRGLREKDCRGSKESVEENEIIKKEDKKAKITMNRSQQVQETPSDLSTSYKHNERLTRPFGDSRRHSWRAERSRQ
jgi:hypothetical protein